MKIDRNDILANPLASAYFALPRESKGVILAGHAEVLEDMKSKEALWDEATGWWGSEPFYLDLRAS
jgi:general stress protein 26